METDKPRRQNGAMLQLEKYAIDREIGGRNKRFVHSSFLSSNRVVQKDVRGHTGCVNSLELSRDEGWVVSGGDDLGVFIWRTGDMMMSRKPKPVAIMETKHNSNIFATEFSADTKFVYSGGRDEKLMKHDIESGKCVSTDIVMDPIDVEIHQIRQHPTDNDVIMVCRSNGIYSFDSRSFERTKIAKKKCMKNESFYCCEINPIFPTYLLTCTSTRGPLIYDLRNFRRPIIGPNELNVQNKRGLTATWNSTGTGFAALFSKKPPVYFDISETFYPKQEYPLPTETAFKDPNYINHQTMKTICFINDDVIAAGSDDSGIYLWKLPKFPNEERTSQTVFERDALMEQQTEADRILKGHRSIPNQIRFSKENNLILSSGVENTVKLWSNFILPFSYDEPFVRRKRHQYEEVDDEVQREKKIRQDMEKVLGDEMDGRATWEDVFGGDPATAEARDTCEMFDVDSLSYERHARLALLIEFGMAMGEADRREENSSDDDEENDELEDAVNEVYEREMLGMFEHQLQQFVHPLGDDSDSASDPDPDSDSDSDQRSNEAEPDTSDED